MRDKERETQLLKANNQGPRETEVVKKERPAEEGNRMECNNFIETG